MSCAVSSYAIPREKEKNLFIFPTYGGGPSRTGSQDSIILAVAYGYPLRTVRHPAFLIILSSPIQRSRVDVPVCASDCIKFGLVTESAYFRIGGSQKEG